MKKNIRLINKFWIKYFPLVFSIVLLISSFVGSHFGYKWSGILVILSIIFFVKYWSERKQRIFNQS